MNYLLCFFQIFLIQYSTAQVFTVGGNNNIPNLNGNIPTAGNFANGFGAGNKGTGGNIQSNLAKAKAGLNANKNIAQNVNNVADVVEICSDNVNIDSPKANAPCSYNENEAVNPMANIVSPPKPYGIEFSSDNLEVQGGVKVKGKMPFNAQVEMKGAMPAQGMGSVSYKCDKMSKDGN